MSIARIYERFKLYSCRTKFHRTSGRWNLLFKVLLYSFLIRNLDSRNKSCIMIITEPTTPLIFMRNPVGLFHLWGVFMYQYPKQILTIAQQVQSYIDAGMVITSRADVEKSLKSVGFYRLRGYSFHLYDNAIKKYPPGTKFEDILKLYQTQSGIICFDFFNDFQD